MGVNQSAERRALAVERRNTSRSNVTGTGTDTGTRVGITGDKPGNRHDSSSSSSGDRPNVRQSTSIGTGRPNFSSPAPERDVRQEQRNEREENRRILDEARQYVRPGLHRDHYITFMREGRMGILRKYLSWDAKEAAQIKRSPFVKDDNIIVKLSAMTVLYDLPDEFIRRAILGNPVPYILAHPNEFPQKLPSAYLDRYPVIYCNYLCTIKGKAPTVEEFKAILTAVREYIQDLTIYGPLANPRREFQTSEEAKKFLAIEAVIPTGARGGHRPDKVNRTDHSERKYIRNQNQLDQAERFVHEQQKLLDHFLNHWPNATDEDEMPWVVTETGWTGTSATRQNQHEKAKSSIPVMNLVDACAQYLFRDKRICFRYLILHNPIMERHAGVAEHVCSRLNHSYGPWGGLNVEVGGNSVELAGKIEPQTWNLSMHACMQKGTLRSRYEAEIEPLKERKRLVEKLVTLKMRDDALADARAAYAKFNEEHLQALEENQQADEEFRNAMTYWFPRAKHVVQATGDIQKAEKVIDKILPMLRRIDCLVNKGPASDDDDARMIAEMRAATQEYVDALAARASADFVPPVSHQPVRQYADEEDIYALSSPQVKSENDLEIGAQSSPLLSDFEGEDLIRLFGSPEL